MKQLLFLFSIILLVSCSNDPKFTEKQIEKTTENCDEDCLNINFSYLFCEKPSEFAENFNKEMESQIVNFLLSSPADSLKVSGVSIEEGIDSFMKDYKNIHEHFPDIAPYELMLNDSISFQNDKIVSLVSKRYSYTGGAYGFSSTIFLNFETSNGKIIPNEALFKNANEILKIAENYFKKEQGMILSDDLNEKGFWFEDNKFHFPQNIGLSTTHLILFYNPYEIAPYVDDTFEVKIPIEEVKSFLNI